MKKDPWLAFTLGLCLQAIAIPISLAMPETLGARKPGEPQKKPEDMNEKQSHLFFETGGKMKDRSSKIINAIKNNAGFIASDWRVLFFACTYVS